MLNGFLGPPRCCFALHYGAVKEAPLWIACVRCMWQVLNYMLGGTGFITHFANVWPEWNVKVHRMLKAGQCVAGWVLSFVTPLGCVM